VGAPAGPRGPGDPEGSRPIKPVSIKKASVENRPAKAAEPKKEQPK
jgi:hypothetical protein